MKLTINLLSIIDRGNDFRGHFLVFFSFFFFHKRTHFRIERLCKDFDNHTVLFCVTQKLKK